MAKLVLTKDPSHSGYYLDGEGNLYVFRFGGRPIKVDGYREDKPRESVKKDKVEIDSEKIINHKKSASLSENNKFIEEVEKEKEKNKKEIDSFIKKSKDPYAGKDLETLNEMKTLQRGLNDELSNTEHRNEDIRRLEIGKELAKESDPSLKNASEELLEREGRKWLQYNDGEILEGEPYKNYKGELEVPTEYLHNRLNSFKNEDYKMTHRPDNDWHMTPDDLLGEDSVAPKDVYEHPEYYTIHSNKNVVKETKEALEKVKGNPDAKITIYRATTGDTINDGDWITLSKSYAEDHNYSQLDGKGKVISKEVPVKDVEWAGDDLSEWGYFPKGEEYKDDNKMSAREFIKKQTGQREMYQSIAKLMNDNEDKLSSEEWKALDNARMILKQNPELIADDSILSDTSKPIHERLSKYMNDNEYKLDSGVWGPLYEANQKLRKHDSGEITKLKDRYEKSQGVSDDWFTEEGRKLGMKDEDIANAIYIKKGAEAQGSTDDNIKRIIANTEKQHYERLIKEYKDAINNPKTGEWDREFMKSELPGLENKAEMFANYEAEFIKRVNRDDEVFNVKYRDPELVENFKARGLDEAYALKDEWLKYSDDVHIYDSNGNEILEDSQKHYTSPTYEKNKINEKKAAYRERIYGADRSTLISMIHNLGLNWNVERFTDQQLYRMLEKELNKKGK